MHSFGEKYVLLLENPNSYKYTKFISKALFLIPLATTNFSTYTKIPVLLKKTGAKCKILFFKLYRQSQSGCRTD